MDWDEHYIRLYLDDRLLNEVDLSKTINADGFNPFHQPQYLLLNLALGKNGGDPSNTQFPLTYEVDYVRVYQKKEDNIETTKLPAENTTYYIRHFSGNLLTDNGLNTDAMVSEAVGTENQQFRFIPVEAKSGKYYIRQESTALYLYRYTKNNAWETRWTADPASSLLEGYSEFEILPTGEKNFVMVKANGQYLGTNDYETNSPVYSDKWNTKIPTLHWEIQLCTSEVGKLALKKQINIAGEFIKTETSGTLPGQYPVNIYNQLLTSFSAAETLYTDSNATQEQVDEMTNELKTLLKTLKENVNILASDIDKTYHIIHSSDYYLGTKGSNAGISIETGSESQEFRFISVDLEENIYNIQQVESNKYLTKSAWNTVWGNDPHATGAKLKLIRYDRDKIRIRFEETGTAEDKSYLGTDYGNNDSYVYADKSGTEWKHVWRLKVTDTSNSSDEAIALNNSVISVYLSEDELIVRNLKGNNNIAVYTLAGVLIFSEKTNENVFTRHISLPPGCYVVLVRGKNIHSQIVMAN